MTRCGLLVGLLLLLDPATLQAGDAVRYYRGVGSVQAAVDALAGRARVREHEVILFVFEQTDFCQRRRSWNEPDYHKHLADWCKGIGAWAEKSGIRALVATTASRASHRVYAKGAVLRKLQKDAGRLKLVPTKKWLKRLLPKLPRKKKPALVYLSDRPDSRWRFQSSRASRAGRSFGGAGGAGTRRVGSSTRIDWDHESIVAALRRAKVTLYVVAPEARFHEFLPEPEIPREWSHWWSVPKAQTRGRRFYPDLDHRGHTDCPSSYGFHPYARTVAATDGAYIFYPAGSSDWLDPCPYDTSLLRAFAPELEPAGARRSRREKDPALRAIRIATAELEGIEGLPVSAYRTVARCGEFAGLAARARGMAAAHDRALAVLDRAQMSAGGGKEVSRRSLAQFRYARVLFAMAAYHHGAWAAAAEQVDGFLRTDENRDHYLKKDLKVCVAEWGSAFKMSDCLPAYDGRKAKSTRARYDAADYRAERPLAQALRDVPVPLRPRAERVIAAARDVMKHEARSPWGWMVYYSGLEAFRPRWSGKLKEAYRYRPKRPSSKKSREKTGDEKPKPGKPGSSGGGTTTGGG